MGWGVGLGMGWGRAPPPSPVVLEVGEVVKDVGFGLPRGEDETGVCEVVVYLGHICVHPGGRGVLVGELGGPVPHLKVPAVAPRS